ncbi:hypothetical protein PUNSTDRAFT_146828 [Punctularia strigosozonata HHB-11173 SS5]|uniref:Afadin and alpha-actinin-binding-domain-containing protein n=1 Tax=Punctularia strigosozonata (strain HHB-11173) TaxID=741275 RepID=R7S241_PUNST|nr:uncharacterized protein PUNSTDRAFT_146828 [Punctularia strigosozonata HHB-11173 SS5]EIN03847.1 hypothetical protein PUNSTDRAFT_146828 [Punctularia strigosozonata HHB-11173 SS5]
MSRPKGVHFVVNDTISDIQSSVGDITSDFAQGSQGSLQFINAQLLAHGFIYGSPLSLDGLGREDEARVVKCLLGMLSCRIEDMARTEELTTKLRTLSYDYERLTSKHKEVSDKAANAEREVNVFKSRLATANRSLQQSELAHKHADAELSRTRTAIQALRSQHQLEIKKKERECERMVERWSKLSDTQLKIGSLPGTLNAPKCANSLVADPAKILCSTDSLMESALGDAEAARRGLARENEHLRELTMQTAKNVQEMIYACQAKAVDEGSSHMDVEQISHISQTELFPLTPPTPDAASAKLTDLFVSLRNAISSINLLASSSSPAAAQATSERKPAPNADRSEAIVAKLTAELEVTRKQAQEYAAQTQALISQLAEAQSESDLAGHLPPEQAAHEMSVDLITAPVVDEEKIMLEDRVKELEEERRRFTEKAVRFGKEREALRREREELEEEKRRLRVEKMLDVLPPTPGHKGEGDKDGVSALKVEKKAKKTEKREQDVGKRPQRTDRMPQPGPSRVKDIVEAGPGDLAAVPKKEKRKQGHGSPAKKVRSPVRVGAGGKKSRHGRRSSMGLLNLLSPTKGKIVPPFETEVIPPPSSKPAGPLVPGAFVLPPKSPQSSLPPGPSGIFSIAAPSNPAPMDVQPTASKPFIGLGLPAFELPKMSSMMTMQAEAGPPNNPIAPVPSQAPPTLAPPAQAQPQITPSRNPGGFPMAKPFAPHMIHAYSPAKPSPLSRILMLADSPTDAMGGGLDAVMETDESADGGVVEESPTPAPPMESVIEARQKGAEKDARGGGLKQVQMLMNKVLDEESPLRDKKTEWNHAPSKEREKERGIDKEKPGRRLTAQEKGKGKASAASSTTGTAKTSAPATNSKAGSAVVGEKRPREKENGAASKRAKAAAQASAQPTRSSSRMASRAGAAIAAASKPSIAGRPGGAKRVPVADLPPESLPTKGPGRK